MTAWLARMLPAEQRAGRFVFEPPLDGWLD